MKLTLRNEQKQVFKIQHSTTRDGRFRDGIRAIILTSNSWTPRRLLKLLLFMNPLFDNISKIICNRISPRLKLAVLYSIHGVNKLLHHNGSTTKSLKETDEFDGTKR